MNSSDKINKVEPQAGLQSAQGPPGLDGQHRIQDRRKSTSQLMQLKGLIDANTEKRRPQLPQLRAEAPQETAQMRSKQIALPKAEAPLQKQAHPNIASAPIRTPVAFSQAQPVIQRYWDVSHVEQENVEKIDRMVSGMREKYVVAAFRVFATADEGTLSIFEQLVDKILGPDLVGNQVKMLLLQAYDDEAPHSAGQLLGLISQIVQSKGLDPVVLESDEDEEFAESEEDLIALAEDYGYEAGVEYAKQHNGQMPEKEVIEEAFTLMLEEEPQLGSYFAQFAELFAEGLVEIHEEIREYGIENYEQWENDLTQIELHELVLDQKLYAEFHSDMDQGQELHRVYPVRQDELLIIVESNPIPLATIIKTKSWQGVDVTKILPALKTAAGKAQTALYNIAGNAASNITGSRTNANMNKLRTALGNIAQLLAKQGAMKNALGNVDLPETDLSQSEHHGQNAAPFEGIHVKAKPLSLNSADHGSKPKDGRLMTSMRALAGPEHKSYVQMHLLNDLVFGPGELWNLTPGPKKSNSDMEKDVEDPLKRAIIDKGLVINFEAIVNYKEDPNGAALKDINQNADRFRFKDIKFKAEQLAYNGSGKPWKKATVTDPDVAKVNNAKINWKYGSLTPLKPKPKILDKKTTLQELLDAGIKNATAVRILNFVKKAPKSAIQKVTGKDKKGKLAEEIKKYDGKRLPSMAGWGANSVLWT